MPLTGEQKKAYQREYMRNKRLGLTGSNKGLTKLGVGLINKKLNFEAKRVVPGEGLEPTRIAPADFKSAASATSAIPAHPALL